MPTLVCFSLRPAFTIRTGPEPVLEEARMQFLPCIDSEALAERHRRQLNIPRRAAAALGRSAVEAIDRGFYGTDSGARVDWSQLVDAARAAKRTIPPDEPLPATDCSATSALSVQVCNETTLHAAARFVQAGHRPLVLNFANGLHPGGGFLSGARAQEESLCRSSGLYATLVGDPMYDHHRLRDRPDSSDWMILSPDVPVFRSDDGVALDRPWLASFLTAAAPVAQEIGQPESGDLLRQRIHRALAIAAAYRFRALVLGAWGCGAFGNVSQRTAVDFRNIIENDFATCFTDIVFAITDWSADRRMLGPFRDVFR